MKKHILTLIVMLFASVAIAQNSAFGVDLKLPAEFKIVTAANGKVNIRKSPASKSPVLLRYFGDGSDVTAAWSNQVKNTKGTVRLMLTTDDLMPVIGDSKGFYKVLEDFFEVEGYVGKGACKLVKYKTATESSLIERVGGYHCFTSGPYKGLFIYEDDGVDGLVFVLGTFVDNMPVAFREVGVGSMGYAERLVINEATGKISCGSAVQKEGGYIDYAKLTPGELQQLMKRLGISATTEQNCLKLLLDVTEHDMQYVRPVKFPIDSPTYTRTVHVGN